MLLGPDFVSGLGEVWRESWRQAVLVGDENTAPLFFGPLEAWLGSRVERLLPLRIPAGEGSKTREMKAELEDAMLAAGIDRRACVVAVGGGVVLDLAGFVAATYLRGVAHLNLATSLLAQVDAAVGGKTGVNTSRGKNLIGAFHPPRAVLVARAALSTLPEEELRCGLAEAVKHAVVADAELFASLEAWGGEGGLVLPEELLGRCVRIKAEVVEQDEREAGLRQILNFGHTAGHAIEAATGHAVPHGRAVAAGMVVEARVAEALCGFGGDERARLVALLERLGLPTRPPVPFAEARVYFGADKKTRGGEVRCALPLRLGEMEPSEGAFAVTVPLERFEAAWSDACSA